MIDSIWISYFFRRKSLYPLHDLLNAVLWTDKNFKSINDIILEIMKDFNFESIKERPIILFGKMYKDNELKYAENESDNK